MIDIDLSLESRHRQNAEGCVKTWEDLVRYRTVLDQVDPKVIIECGTFSGKSALWLARESDAMIVTIDVADQVPADVREAWGDRVAQFLGSTTSPEAQAFVAAHVEAAHHLFGADCPILVILDSDHGKYHVLDEMAAYSKYVTPGSYMVAEDGLLRWMPDEERAVYAGDPLEAIEVWMDRDDDEWVIDTDIEFMFPVTQFPSGWLRRS